MKYSPVFLLLTAVSASVFGQFQLNPDPGSSSISPHINTPNDRTNLGSLIPPSPDAAQAVKYADFPMSYSLGVPELNLPLYTVKSGDLSHTVSFSYHASGIKVDEIAGVLGLGWNLQAGGTIAKTVIGMPDIGTHIDVPGSLYGITIPFEYIPASTIRNCRNSDTTSYFQYMYNVFENRRDSKYDRYSYNFCGYSGTFFLMPQPRGGFEFVDLSGSDLQFAYSDTIFHITSPDGTRYSFTPQERVSRKQPPREMTILTPPLFLPPDYETISSWRLSRITAANGRDSIVFRYAPAGLCKRREYAPIAMCEKYEDPFYGQARWLPVSVDNTYNYTDTEYRCAVLEQILFPGGVISFSYDDLPGVQPNYPKRLREITVRNTPGQVIRRFLVGQSYQNTRLGMQRVEVYGSSSDLLDRYDFSYNGTPDVPHNAQDYFGYYNGQDRNQDMLFLRCPSANEFIGIDTVKRSYHFPSALRGSLTEIRRLRGERTVLTYGKNCCPTIHGPVHVGIRVESIGIYNGQQLIRRRNFEYKDPVLTFDFIPQRNFRDYITVSAHHFFVFVSPLLVEQVNIDKITFHQQTVLPGMAPESQKVFYRHVTERILSGDGMETCAVDYHYDSQAAIHPASPSRPHWPESSPGFPLKRDRRYIHTDYAYNGYYLEFTPVYNHLIRKVTSYAHETAPASGLLKTIEESSYAKFREQNVPVGFYLRDMFNYGRPAFPANYGERQQKYRRDFAYTDLMARVVCWKPVSQTTTNTYSSGNQTESVVYNYTDAGKYTSWPNRMPFTPPLEHASDNLLLKHEKRTVDGVEYTRRYLYTSSYAGGGNGSSTLHRPAGEELYRTGGNSTPGNPAAPALLEGTYIAYEKDVRGIFPGYSITMRGQDTVSRYRIHEYDHRGRPLHVSQEGDLHICYLWDPEGLHPVAEIKGATLAQVRAVLGDLLTGDPSVLRTALPHAQVTTWTPLPLVGVTSVTDPSGRTVHYEYDAAWRLCCIRDEDGNIRETFEYKNL